jgi:PAS domain S-box-containing protein
LKLVALRAAGELERNRIEYQKDVMFESLRETSDYLENLIGYANAPIIVWDPAYKITRFNRAFERLTGCPAAEMLGKGLEILFPEEQRDEWLSYIQRTAGNERWDGVEIPIQHVNGDIRMVLWNSAYINGMDGKTVIASIAQGQDITERKILEDRLRKREREVSSLVENAPDMIERFDTDLNEIYANQEVVNQLGVPLERLIGKTPLDVRVPSQQAEVFVQGLKKTLETEKAQEVWQVFPNPPEQRYFLTHIVPELDPQGKIESLLAISRDFTEYKRLEMALKNSLVEKEALLHENHHRVKNNLQVITSLLGLQMSQIHDPDDKVLFEESRNRIQMIAMVHETLVQSKNMAQISMGDYMEKLTTFVYQSFGAPAHINIELMCENVQLNIEQAMPIGLITNELFTNAFKYAFPEGQPGTIKISLEYLDAEDHKPAEVLLMVADNGVGLPAGWDIKQSESLGLSLVQILTRQLHGTLLVESQSGGASFSLRFRVMNNPSDKNGDSTRQNG